jgi:hypothetical protein
MNAVIDGVREQLTINEVRVAAIDLETAADKVIRQLKCCFQTNPTG